MFGVDTGGMMAEMRSGSVWVDREYMGWLVGTNHLCPAHRIVFQLCTALRITRSVLEAIDERRDAAAE